MTTWGIKSVIRLVSGWMDRMEGFLAASKDWADLWVTRVGVVDFMRSGGLMDLD